MNKRIMASLAVAASLGMLMTGCANQAAAPGSTGAATQKVNLPIVTSVPVPANAVLPAGDGNAKCDSTVTLGYIGAETGPTAQLGINI